MENDCNIGKIYNLVVYQQLFRIFGCTDNIYAHCTIVLWGGGERKKWRRKHFNLIETCILHLYSRQGYSFYCYANRVSKNRLSKNRVSKNRVAKNRESKNRVSKNRVSKNRVSKNRVSKNMVSKNRVSKNRVS